MVRAPVQAVPETFDNDLGSQLKMLDRHQSPWVNETVLCQSLHGGCFYARFGHVDRCLLSSGNRFQVKLVLPDPTVSG